MFPAVTMFTLGFKERIGVQKLEYLLLCAQESKDGRCPLWVVWGLFLVPSIHSFLTSFRLVSHVPIVCVVCGENSWVGSLVKEGDAV